MKDHQSRIARLALDPVDVCQQQPDWRMELLLVAALLAAIGVLMTYQIVRSVDQVADSNIEQALYWKKRVERDDAIAMVRIERSEDGYHCAVQNVRREWELAVAAECQVLGQLLQQARATP